MLALAAATLVLMVSGQDELNPGVCNSPLGLSDGSIGDGQLSSLSGEDSRPSSGRLGNEDGAWCFSNTSIIANTAVLSLELPERRFVTGFATQGPPEKIYPSTYHHVVAFSVEHSLDANEWAEFNQGTLFFDTDKNETIDTINYHTSNTIVLAQYIRINVTLQVSGFPEICLRFELYGCNTDIQPQTQLQAMTTPDGKIEVSWSPPSADTSLETEGFSRALLRPSGYVVRYRPEGSSSTLSAATADRSLTLEDVRLGATYGIKLECLAKDVVVDCGVVRVEAYPPCPEDWTGGNEYHCFLYLADTGSFEDAKDSCLALDIAGSLGKLSNLVDDSESEFLASKIISEDVTQLWLIGEACEENDDCCRVLKKEDDVFKQYNCEDEVLSSAICLRDHKGEGAKLRINVVEAFEDGTSVRVKWGYEGIGWKTDKLQTKLWTDTTEENSVTSTFSTLNDSFIMANLQPETMYSILLRPAPNIRSDEFTYKFIIVDYSKEAGGYGALLTPISMSLYVIWSGTLKVKWDTASTYSTSGSIKEASKYSITYEKVSSGDDEKQVKEISNREFLLTPLEVKVKYQFSLGCYFADKFHPCGSASIRTDPPDSFNRDESLVFTIFEWFDDSSKNWFEAESDCQEREGHLTSILSEEEGITLLNILPSSDAKAWTGARLVRNGTNLWTDGHGMYYLPMAKNSRVIVTKESCCRALNAFGKLRLEGGICSDNLPYVCKYLVKDILHPVDVTAGWQKWDSFEVAWKLPQKGWLPTEYKVTVCEEGVGECIEEKSLKKLKFVADGLKELTPYEVEVSGSFEPIPGYTAQTKKKIFTYPRRAIREDISTTGEVSLATPMLIALGKKNAQLTATIARAGEILFIKSGDVEKIEFSKLTPEEEYEVLVEEKEGEWKYRITLEAVPSCDKSDVRVGTKCFSLVKETADFQKAVELCGTRRQSAVTLEQKLWTSNDLEMLLSVVQEIGYQSPVWMEKPSDSSIIAPDETCSTNSLNPKCCSYSISKHKVLCSNCCSEKQAFVCAYETTANLGQVGDLNPTEIGDKTLGVQWSHPEGISWSIKRYEVNWFSAEKESDAAKTKVVEGQTSVLLDGLEFGTEYHIGVLPLGSKRMKGKELRITLATLEPRSSLVVTVEPNGVAYVKSPILMEKGRGTEEVTVEVLHADTKKPLVVMKSTAGKAVVTGLEPGLEYYVEMKTNNKAMRSFKFNTTFKALPF